MLLIGKLVTYLKQLRFIYNFKRKHFSDIYILHALLNQITGMSQKLKRTQYYVAHSFIDLLARYFDPPGHS